MLPIPAVSAAQSVSDPIQYLVYGSAGEPLQILGNNPFGQGLVSDVVQEVFRPSTYEVTTVVKPLKRIKREMQYGQAKRWITYALRSWKKEGVWENATFADVDLVPYALSLVYYDKNHHTPFHLKDLNQRNVVWLQGFKYPGALLFREKHNFSYLRASNHLSAIKMIEADRAPYFMENEARIRFAMMRLGISADDYSFVPLNTEIEPTGITLLMSNDLSEKTRAFVNRRLQELQQSGWLAERARHYGFFVEPEAGFSEGP